MTTSCAHTSRFLEPLVLCGPLKVTFGTVPVCAACRRITGDVALSRSVAPEVKAAIKAWTGLAWSMMLEKHAYPPFCFVREGKGLKPEDYTGELKIQPDIDEEVPF